MHSGDDSALRAAVDAAHKVPLPTSVTTPQDAAALGHLWLSRVLKQACYGVGQCLGIEACSYYACTMQDSKSVADEACRPPYFCPVDLAKLYYGIRPALQVPFEALPFLQHCQEDPDDKDEYGRMRYLALLEWCEARQGSGPVDSHAAWLRGVLGLKEDWRAV